MEFKPTKLNEVLDLITSKNSPRICILGNFHAVNLGDEAIVWVMIQDLRQISNRKPEITIPSYNPENTRNTQHVESLYPSFFNLINLFFKTDIFIIGGGSIYSSYAGPLVYLTPLLIIINKLFGKKTVIYSIGYDSNTPKLLNWLMGLSLRFANFVSVRDELSFNILRKFRKRIELISDPVLRIDEYLPIPKLEKTDTITFALNGINDPHLNEIIKSEFRKVISMIETKYPGFKINLLSFADPDDFKFNNSINTRGENITIYKFQNIETSFKIISKSKVFVASRLHANIFGFIAKTPTVNIAYANKNKQIFKQIGISEFIDINEINAENLFNQIEAKLNEK